MFRFSSVRMILVSNMVLVLQKSKKVKTRVDLIGKRVGIQNGILSLNGNRTINA